MTPFEIGKIVLYFIEWIWTLVIFAVTADSGSVAGVCLFDGTASVCNFAIAAGVIGWILVTLVGGAVVFGILKNSSGMIPAKIEFGVHVFLCIWFFILACVVSANYPLKNDTTNTVVAFSWMLVFFHLMSAGLAFLERNKGDTGDGMPPPSSMAMDI
mmetsp:Transcript_18530/g.18609  ORF Transcript_18530/g.18609 Transcript_18530/m.18609 type:complete len:157 (+) Transcript_18530:76-546(+)